MKQLIYFLLLLSTGSSFSQSVHFIGFTNKDYTDTTKATSSLSSRSIDRRINQGIEIDSLDFPVKNEYIDSVLSISGKKQYTSKWMNGILVHNLELDSVTAITNLNFVSYVHDLSKSNTGGISGISTDTSFYGNTINTSHFLDLDYYHDQDLLGQNILISFFDAGFPGMDTIRAFEHIFTNNKIIDQYNIVENSTDVFKLHEHGTTVASITLALDSGNFVGVAPLCDASFYITENVENETVEEEYNWLIAAEKADSAGTDIINSSLSYTTFDIDSISHTFSQLDGKTAIISKAAQIASNKGILVVNSAGNSGNSNTWAQVGFPADAKEVLTVGSIDFNGDISIFSSYGEINGDFQKPELVAPGSNVSIIKPDGSISISSGTSFSAPAIAGYSALLWQSQPNITAQELKLDITSLGNLASNPTTEQGYGYPSLLINGITTEKHESEIVKTSYYNLNGQEIESPSSLEVYIVKTLYSDGKISRKKGVNTSK